MSVSWHVSHLTLADFSHFTQRGIQSKLRFDLLKVVHKGNEETAWKLTLTAEHRHFVGSAFLKTYKVSGRGALVIEINAADLLSASEGFPEHVVIEGSFRAQVLLPEETPEAIAAAKQTVLNRQAEIVSFVKSSVDSETGL